jgi:hypothetical protein
VERPWEAIPRGKGFLDGLHVRRLRRHARRRGRPSVFAATSNGALPLRTFGSRHHISLRRNASAGTAAVARTSRRIASAPRRSAAALGGLVLLFSSRARVMPARALMTARVSARSLRARPRRIAPLAVAAVAVPAATVLILLPQLRTAFDPGTISPIVTPAATPSVKHFAVSADHATGSATKAHRVAAPSTALSPRYAGPADSRAYAKPALASYVAARPVVYGSRPAAPVHSAPTHSAPPPSSPPANNPPANNPPPTSNPPSNTPPPAGNTPPTNSGPPTSAPPQKAPPPPHNQPPPQSPPANNPPPNNSPPPQKDPPPPPKNSPPPANDPPPAQTPPGDNPSDPSPGKGGGHGKPPKSGSDGDKGDKGDKPGKPDKPHH